MYPGEREVQIMDYQTQQAKLFPALAMAFSFHFAGQSLWEDYTEVHTTYLRLPDLLRKKKHECLFTSF